MTTVRMPRAALFAARALWALALFLAAPVHAVPAGAGQDVVVDLSCDPVEAEIGQPVTWSLIVEHPRGGTVRLEHDARSPFDSTDGRRRWVELSERRRTVVPIGDARTRTTFAWTVAALDSGERTLSGLRVAVELPDRVVSRAVEDATLLVRAALAEGEEQPRPLAGFRPAPPGADGRASRWILPALILATVAALAFVVRRRWLSPIVLPDRDDPLDELEALAESMTDAPGSAAELGYDLSHLLRRATDTTLGEPRSPLTDAEWASQVEQDERLPATLREPLVSLVRDLEPLKYGGTRPTRFAMKDFLARAREPLTDLTRPLDETGDEPGNDNGRLAGGRRGAA